MKLYLTKFGLYHYCLNNLYTSVYIKDGDYFKCSSNACGVRVPNLLTIGYIIQSDILGGPGHIIIGNQFLRTIRYMSNFELSSGIEI